MRLPFFILLCFCTFGCKTVPPASHQVWGKLGFQIDKVSTNQDYEFCITDTPELREKVLKLDASVRFMASPGRIGCKKGQVLCIGSTASPKYKRRLYNLCRIDFVQRIELTHWE
jgi:hypothetical protein